LIVAKLICRDSDEGHGRLELGQPRLPAVLSHSEEDPPSGDPVALSDGSGQDWLMFRQRQARLRARVRSQRAFGRSHSRRAV